MRFANWIAGRESTDGTPIAIRDYRGEALATVPGCDTIDVVEARIFAASARWLPMRRPLSERIVLLQELVADYLSDPRLALIARASGTPQAYLDGTVDGLRDWARHLDTFVARVDGFSRTRDGKPLHAREVVSPFAVISAGNAEIYEPPFLLGQLILAGTHFVARPSGKDLGTHIFIEKLAQRGLTDIGQKLSWSSVDHPELVKQLLRFSSGFSVFASDAAYDSIVRISDGDFIHEDLSAGRLAHRYGSGYSLAVVMPDAMLTDAVHHIVRAASFNKGDKCWAVTNVFVQRSIRDHFTESLVERARQLVPGDPQNRLTELPSFPSGGLAALRDDLPPDPLFGSIRPDDSRMDLLVYGPSARAIAEREIGAPVIVLLPFDDLEDATAQIRATMVCRGTDALLSLGFFGRPEDAQLIAARVPHHSLKLNSDLKVDVMLPHQGSYFMLDPSR